MKYGFYILLGTMIISFLVSIITNCFSKTCSNVKKDAVKFSSPLFFGQLSIHNAMIINRSSSSKNGPVRPEGELYSDGLMREIGTTRSNSTFPENVLINIRDSVSNSLEDQNVQ